MSEESKIKCYHLIILILLWCEEKDIENYKQIFPIQLKDNLKELMDTHIKYISKGIENIDCFLYNKTEIKIQKL